MDKYCESCKSNRDGTCIDSVPCMDNDGATPSGYSPKKDNVNHPSHYTSGEIECIEALESATVNLSGIEAVCTANAIKYLWRWKQKNGVEDLSKAKWYIDRLIKTQEKPHEQK